MSENREHSFPQSLAVLSNLANRLNLEDIQFYKDIGEAATREWNFCLINSGNSYLIIKIVVD